MFSGGAGQDVAKEKPRDVRGASRAGVACGLSVLARKEGGPAISEYAIVRRVVRIARIQFGGRYAGEILGRFAHGFQFHAAPSWILIHRVSVFVSRCRRHGGFSF